jgi:uncharacterized protein (TIGR00266 family)
MNSYTVQSGFLQVSLEQGMSIIARRRALIAMNDSVELKSTVTGGLIQGFLRRLSTSDTLFHQHFTAVRGRGDLLLSPRHAGDIKVLEVGIRQYGLNDGVFLAADSTVCLTPCRRPLFRSLFGGAGFFIAETSGSGHLAVNARGGIFEVELKPGGDMIVDEQHLVAWELGLKQQFLLGSNRPTRLTNRLIGSQISGERVLSHFTGRGRLVLSSLERR